MEHDGNKLANSKVLARCTGTHARARDMKASQRTTNPNWVSRRGRNSYGDGGVRIIKVTGNACRLAKQSRASTPQRQTSFPAG